MTIALSAEKALDVVRSELERLFTMEEMEHMSRVLLGLRNVAGTTKAAYARALTERCFEGGLEDALVDVMFYARSSVDPRLRDLDRLLRPDLPPDTVFGEFTIERKVGTSMRGAVYLAEHRSGAKRALEILGSGVSRDRRSVHRFLTANRLVATIPHPGLAAHLDAGELEPGVYWIAHDWVPGTPLSERPPGAWEDVLPIARAILEPLAALHGAHVVHGGLHVENVIEGDPLRLVGFGTDFLFHRPADLRGDVRAFGVLVRELVAEPPPPAWREVLDAIAAGGGPKDAASLLTAIETAARSPLPPAVEEAPRTEEDLVAVLAASPDDTLAFGRLVELRRKLGKWEDVVEMLVAKSETRTGEERAKVFAEIGRLYATELDDPEQAALAFARAVADAPTNDGHAAELERVAGTTWAEHLEAMRTSEEPALLVRVARWYETQLGKVDDALAVWRRILALAPSSDVALDGLIACLRRAERWAELVDELLAHAEALGSTPRARDLLGHAADVLDTKLDEPGRARSLLERILADDPGHDRAGEAIGRIAERSGEYRALIDVLERRAGARTGPRRAELVARIGEVLEHKLDEPAEAARRYEAATELDEANVIAREGLLRLRRARVELADRAWESGRTTDAAREYEALLAGGAPVHVRVRYVLEWPRLDRPKDRLLAATSELDPPLASAPAVLDVLLAAGELDEVARLAAKLPREGVILERLGEAAKRRGDPEAALAAWTEGGHHRAAAELLAQLGRDAEATLAFERALEAEPRDRKILTRLMQLHSAAENWPRVSDVVLRLSELVDDPKQRAKYLHTAGTIADEHLADPAAALAAFRSALEADPDLDRAAEDALRVATASGDAEELLRLAKRRLERARAAGDRVAIVAALDALGELYRPRDRELAIEAWEAAQAFEARPERASRLAALYGEARDFDKAVAAEWRLVREDPYRVESYHRLRKLYADAGREDPAWCLAQALTLLGLATDEEAALYAARRSDAPARAARPLDEEDWARLLHWDLDPLLTRVFGLLEPTILRTRTQAISTSTIASRAASAVVHAAGLLGLPLPALVSTHVPDDLRVAPAVEPAMYVGPDGELPEQTLAFVAGRELASFRPGFYVRHLVSTGTGLKGWLFAAIKTCVPAFAIPPEIAGQVRDAMNLLDLGVTERELLASAVAKLLQAGGALDLKKWAAAVDLTADRVGLFLANDLQSAAEGVREGTASPNVPVKERMKDLVVFSVSEDYFALRRRLE